MRVLFLHQHFKTPTSGGAIRSYYLAKALVDKGHTAIVVTSSEKTAYAVENYEGIEVHNLPIAYSNYFGFWKRVFSFLKFNWWIFINASKLKDVDLCYAISVPLTIGLPARWIKWKYNIPYIFEVGDLWPDVPIELDVIQNKWLKKYLLRMEQKIYQESTCVVALSNPIAKAIEKKCPRKTVHVIPNMADQEFYVPEVKSLQLEEKFKVTGKLVISYFGAMGFANGLEYLLSCAKACKAQNLPVHFLLAGDGVEKNNLKAKANNLQLKNLTFQDFQIRDGVKELMNVTDVVFVCYRNSKILETGSPNKYFDGLAAGKVIMTNFGGWIKEEIESNHCGFSIDPENPKSILAPIQKLLDQQTLAEFQQQSRLLSEKYSRTKLTNEWIEILQSTIN